jgi:Sel1 repeat
MEYVEKNKYYLMLIGLCLILFTICIIQGQKLKEYRNGGLTSYIDSTAIAVDTTVAVDTTMAVDTAVTATNTGDYSTWSVEDLKPYAVSGDVNAQVWLGKKYDDLQDYTNAMIWYLEADKQGSSYAQNNIGALYFQGHGVDTDTESAKQWFLKAARQDNEIAKEWLKDKYDITEY